MMTCPLPRFDRLFFVKESLVAVVTAFTATINRIPSFIRFIVPYPTDPSFCSIPSFPFVFVRATISLYKLSFFAVVVAFAVAVKDIIISVTLVVPKDTFAFVFRRVGYIISLRHLYHTSTAHKKYADKK